MRHVVSHTRCIKLLFALPLLVHLACATATAEVVWHQWLTDADRHYDHRRYQTAEALYRKLLPKAPEPSYERYIAFRLAQITAYSGDPERGRAMLTELEARPNPTQDEWTAWAAFERGKILDRIEARPHDAARVYLDVITRYPDEPIAVRALDFLTRYHRKNATLPTLLVDLGELYPHIADADLGDNVYYLIARIHLDDLQDIATARSTLEDFVEAYPRSPFKEDAVWRLAELARERGEAIAALEMLDTIAQVHDTSWTLGEYHSRLRNDAMLLRAEIMLHDLGDPERAIAEYERILTTFYKYFGDAIIAYDITEIYREHIGDREAYIASLEDYIDDYPESVLLEKVAIRLELARAGEPLETLPDAARTLRQKRRAERGGAP